jgi:hypothetical protein
VSRRSRAGLVGALALATLAFLVSTESAHPTHDVRLPLVAYHHRGPGSPPTSTTTSSVSTTTDPKTTTTTAPKTTTTTSTSTTTTTSTSTTTTTSTSTTTTTTTTTVPTGTTSSSGEYTQQPGYPVFNNTGTTLPITTVAIGDIVLVIAHTAPSSGVSHVTSITDSNDRISWQTAKSSGFTNHPSGDALEIWYGVVKSTGATTVDVHWSGTTFDHFVWGAEWHSSLGATANWSLVAAGNENATLCTKGSCAFPTLSSGSSGGLYWGWGYPATTSRPGSTAGFSYFITTVPTHGNVLLWNGSLAASTAYSPTFIQVTGTSWYDATAVIVDAT